MIPFLLLTLGLILILFEFYLPGALLGILGGISILIGIVIFAFQASSFSAIVLFIAAAAVAVALLIRFAMWLIISAKPDDSIYSNASQEGYQACTYDKMAIGKRGVVIADLKPGGYILVEGSQHPAISISGYIGKGEYVTVVGGQEQSLMVKRSPGVSEEVVLK